MFEKVFRDPIHDYISVSHPLINDLINAKEFQRLRRIKQVPMTAFTFHGAEHSRFSHCLGVYEIARQITEGFSKHYPDLWQASENLLTQVAALLHDIGHGAYSHTFERLFDTDHEALTQEIITNKETEIYQLLSGVAPDFPNRVASVINHTYPNKQVIQLISSQIDCDRMDYLLRDSYYTGTSYGAFDLTRILRVIRPSKTGICFTKSGMHAVEDYIISRYQMYMQVYFHPASRAMEVLLQNLLKRAKMLYANQPDYFIQSAKGLVPFFENKASLTDYLALDDAVMTAYFHHWTQAEDPILKDLAKRFLNRHLFKSLVFENDKHTLLKELQQLIFKTGFDPKYYTATHVNFDLPYDIYRPKSNHPRTQIDILEEDGTITELSQLSSLVKTLSGQIHGDRRFYFPKDMLKPDDLFSQTKKHFHQKLMALKEIKT